MNTNHKEASHNQDDKTHAGQVTWSHRQVSVKRRKGGSYYIRRNMIFRSRLDIGLNKPTMQRLG